MVEALLWIVIMVVQTDGFHASEIATRRDKEVLLACLVIRLRLLLEALVLLLLLGRNMALLLHDRCVGVSLCHIKRPLPHLCITHNVSRLLLVTQD